MGRAGLLTSEIFFSQLGEMIQVKIPYCASVQLQINKFSNNAFWRTATLMAKTKNASKKDFCARFYNFYNLSSLVALCSVCRILPQKFTRSRKM